jgi:hypothetical protein
VNIDNQACWSVENPEGAYTLEVMSESWTKCIFANDDYTHSFSKSPQTEDSKYELIIPNRAVQQRSADAERICSGQVPFCISYARHFQ